MPANNAPMFLGSQLAAAVYLGTRRLWSRPETLSLDFVNNVYRMGSVTKLPTEREFSELITFTRPTGGGRFNSQGQYEWLPADQPRIDYDPVTGECRGLLIEEQRTNLLTNSVNPIQQPDTVLAAPEPRLPDHVGYSRAGGIDSAAVAMTAGTAYVASVYVRIEAVATAGSVTASVSGVAPGTAQVVTAADVGRLFRLSSGAYTPGTNISLRARATPTDGITISVFAPQIEAGSFPTSYIPTTDAQVTRAADVASVNELSPWFNAEQGTLYCVASRPAGIAAPLVSAVLRGPGTAERIEVGCGTAGANQAFVVAGGALAAVFGGPTLSDINRQAITYSPLESGAAFNGVVSPRTTITQAPSGVYQLLIGNSTAVGRRWNGHIRSIRFYPRRLSDDELQALTA